MNRDELINLLNQMPNWEVGTADGTVINAEQSSYDDENGTHNYIHLEISED